MLPLPKTAILCWRCVITRNIKVACHSIASAGQVLRFTPGRRVPPAEQHQNRREHVELAAARPVNQRKWSNERQGSGSAAFYFGSPSAASPFVQRRFKRSTDMKS